MVFLKNTFNVMSGSCTVMFTGGKDVENESKKRLLNIFGDWTDMVTDLIR